MDGEEHITRSGALLPEDQIKIATARSVRDWMEIYIEVLARALEGDILQVELKGVVAERFRGETLPRLRRIVRDFEVAGLTINDEIEVEGIHLVPGQRVIWEDPNRPEVKFIWPDGSELIFQGESAVSAVGFFEFWAKHQIPVTGLEAGKRRLITPGSAEEQEYYSAKARELQGGDPNA